MEYTIQKLGRLAGITPRTLRYYDEIGILKPKRISSSGYRIYGPDEVNRLQQILLYRELDVSLDAIQQIMAAPEFNISFALKEHKKKLVEKRIQLDKLIQNVEKTIALTEGRILMNDSEKFEGFKQNMIDHNEKKYGKEIRQKYGDEIVNKSNQKLKHMTKEEHSKITKLAEDIIAAFLKAYQTGDPAGELAMKAVSLHKAWLSFYWDSYSPDAHIGISQMYVDDERFSEYYNTHQPGLAVFVRDAVHACAKKLM